MNLFSRLSEILEDADDPNCHLSLSARYRVDRLVRAMEVNLARTKRTAVTVIAAEHAVAHELGCQLHRREANDVLVNRMREEHARAMLLECSVKKTLREMREGIDQARRFRATILRWKDIDEGARLSTWRRLFWKAYHRLCDLTDKQLDRLEASTEDAPTRCIIHRSVTPQQECR